MVLEDRDATWFDVRADDLLKHFSIAASQQTRPVPPLQGTH